jgi:nitrogen fixation protein
MDVALMFRFLGIQILVHNKLHGEIVIKIGWLVVVPLLAIDVDVSIFMFLVIRVVVHNKPHGEIVIKNGWLEDAI